MDKLREAILGTGGRGSLYRWLRRHHDELVELLGQVSRPDWKMITESLADEKLLDGGGNTPTPERVRQTWVRVRKDVELAHRKKDRSQASAGAVTAHNRQAPAPQPPAKALAKQLPSGQQALSSFKERLKKGD